MTKIAPAICIAVCGTFISAADRHVAPGGHIVCNSDSLLLTEGIAMQLSDVRIKLCNDQGNRLKAFCALTFDNTFVIRDVKLIDGNDGLFLAMPSRKLSDHCGRCGDKNHLRARYCNNCGSRLDEDRYTRYQNGNGATRLKLHADIAHPINADCRHQIEEKVINAFHLELERSKQPGYIAPALDGEDFEFVESRPLRDPGVHLRPTGSMQ